MEPIDEWAFSTTEAGRELGHDYCRLSRLPMQAAWPTPLKEGFAAAAAQGGSRHTPDRFERKWLQLRYSAWQRRRVVAADVTVELLRQLDLTHCPITREPLTHGRGADTDWSIDRLNNDGAYAAANLAVMSTRVNRAKAALSFDEVLRFATVSHDGPAAAALPATQWMRLAVLMLGPSFATADRHRLAPALPLCAPLPVHSVRLALQQVQRLFTVQAGRPAGKNALVRDFRRACRGEASQQLLRRLADAVHQALKQLGPAEQCWDIWLQPAVMTALVQWRESLGEREWAEAARIAGQLAGGLRVTAASLSPWHLATRGYRQPTIAPPPSTSTVLPVE